MPEPRIDRKIRQAKPYSRLAPVYDDLMEHVDYRQWAEYIERLLHRFHKRAEVVLDASCGTGTLAVHMCRRGYHMTGMDGAPEMLTIARKKMKRMALNIPILDGDMRDFKTTETFEVVLSMYDSINYLLNPDDLKRAFTCVHKALQPGGIFIFDICTEYNSLIHFSDDYSEDTINGIWFSRHTFYRKRDRIQFNDFRIREKNGDLYQEFHRQRVYKQAEIRDALLQAGFSLDGMFAGYTVQKPRSSTDRIHFVARRGK